MVEPVSSELPRDLTVDAFLAWADGRDGRYELELGRVIAMAPEQIGHVRTKAAVQRALETAIRRANTTCEALADGVTVRIDQTTAYEPDALVYCGERLPPDAIEVPHPVVVVEVVSPSTGRRDHHDKRVGYFSVPSVEHYLIVDAESRILIHHARSGDEIATRILHGGRLRLDPPGLEMAVEDLFGAED